MPSLESIYAKLLSFDNWYRTQLEKPDIDKKELRREYLTKKWKYLCDVKIITWGQWEEWKFNQGANELK